MSIHPVLHLKYEPCFTRPQSAEQQHVLEVLDITLLGSRLQMIGIITQREDMATAPVEATEIEQAIPRSYSALHKLNLLA